MVIVTVNVVVLTVVVVVIVAAVAVVVVVITAPIATVTVAVMTHSSEPASPTFKPCTGSINKIFFVKEDEIFFLWKHQ